MQNRQMNKKNIAGKDRDLTEDQAEHGKGSVGNWAGKLG